ncbi:MAG TPA: hypothetical protein VOA41_10555 [Candidatus Dormibacteraeota bacterium]|nr:hypothetical protein [Candidatus Dormibacteraeota bacterium]
MRSALRQLLAGLLSLAVLCTPLWGSSVPTVGVVLLADQAQLSAAGAAPGATIFDGDKLATETKGSLRVRAGLAQLQLLGGSEVVVNQTGTGVSATLNKGTLAAAAPNAAALEMHVSEARIREHGDGAMRAQVTLVSSKELLISAQRGALEITVGDQTEIIPEATSYRVFVDPPLAGPANASAKAMPRPQGPRGGGARSAGRSRFILIALVVTAVATILTVDEALESPAHP